MEKIDINACIEEIISVLDIQLLKENYTIERQFDAHLPPITADSNKIKQVLMNLLINSCQAMPEGGKISVGTARAGGGDALTIRIEDSGQGISKENLPKTFDPFFTTKGPEKGTGLGLSVSYGIVQQHGGQINVNSALGQGTTFLIRLPVDGCEV
jgi:two-component system NtrC family sensor kinase